MEAYQYSDEQVSKESHLSYLNLPVEIPLQEIEDQLNAKISGLIYEDNSYQDDHEDNLKAKIWKLSPIKMVGIDSSFLFEVPLKIWASAGYKFSPLGITVSGYKDTEFAIRIRFISTLSVSKDWEVHSETIVESYDWITEPNIQIAGFKVPVKSMISRILNRNATKISENIDQQVAKGIELKKYAKEAWNLVQKPVLIAPEYHTWLTVVPKAVLMTPLSAQHGVLRSVIGIQGETQTLTSSTAPVVQPVKNLPMLKLVSQVPEHFRVALMNRISYEEASKLADAQFRGQEFSFLGGKYKVTVASIALYGQNNKMVIKAELKGGLNGTIFLKGVPFFDPASQTLSFKDLDYDLQTKNALVKAADWLLQGQFAKSMQKRMVFPIGEQILETQTNMQAVLKELQVFDGVTVKGQLDEIKPDRVYLTPEHICAVVFANGRVGLSVKGLKNF
ncbi:uncharacterized protein DUF4403 [Dyadobacter jejuensis]|uniref:Uncharacterized protein DUF4403 n=1 Tax=Dyadobacter jejuensis TaxID=1082580 RepID=A0A316AN34_9BACT|nr:DUF4403 family protein [Dyadobacter jejuensis]PWJ58190.1 uncharacterized protein DUF4403 [Dyadobacter jejuensis]